MPKAGTPRPEMRPNRAGNRPSLAAASGISAQIIVQPLSAPKPETMTHAATTQPAHVPPVIASAAVEYGAALSPSTAVGIEPKTATSESR